MTVVPIEGGVTTAAGFRAAGVAAGIKASGALDLTLIVADAPAAAAALFTTNQVKAAPVQVSREQLARSGGLVRAVVVNSGCANACTGVRGLETARATVDAAATLIGCPAEQVLVASTGVIGVHLDRDTVLAGLRAAVSALGPHDEAAARGIMTTDLEPKRAAVRVETERGLFHVGGIAKGAGMIEPNMATMLAFLTTDAAVTPALLDRALREVADRTFNAITVDGECSTNDMVAALASGRSGVSIDDSLYPALVAGLEAVSRTLALAIVRGGEGATKLVAVRVTGADSRADAVRAAKTIANSPLVKTAIHGGDPNWGRLVAAAGRSGARFVLERALVEVGPVVLFRDGQPYDELAPQAAEYMKGAELDVHVDLGTGGSGEATVWTCDLSAEYVRINGEYRT
ncbi:MAG TPA: bifunctional glutamate N-acetyltransferase/amino-acid acetyltransferase ArgJ [Vicinamibacterales bacterium]